MDIGYGQQGGQRVWRRCWLWCGNDVDDNDNHDVDADDDVNGANNDDDDDGAFADGGVRVNRAR